MKEINIKYCMYHYFDGIMNIKDIYPINLNADEIILIQYTGYVTSNFVKPFTLLSIKQRDILKIIIELSI